MAVTVEGAALDVRNVSAGYHDRPVLRDITCSLRAGEVLGILGPNGAGKTTLLRIMSGALAPRSGEIFIGDRPLRSFGHRERARRMAFVPQSLYVPVPFTVNELVEIGRTPHVSGWTSLSQLDRDVITRAIEKVDLLELRNAPVDELSAGERQRAVIAMALAQEPHILLLDEPTAHLDIQHAWSILELIERFALREELAVAISTHDLNLAGEFCSRLLLLEKGRVVMQGKREEVLDAESLSRVYEHPLDVLHHNENVWIRPRRASKPPSN